MLLTGAFLSTALFGVWGNGAAAVAALLGSGILGLLCIIRSGILLFRRKETLGSGKFLLSIAPTAAVLFMSFRGDLAIVNVLLSPVVFRGTCEHTVTFVHLVLREDGSCEFEPGSFLDRNWQVGTWTRSGDTVHVDIEQARNAGPTDMDLLVTGEGLWGFAADSVHAHGFAGMTNRIRGSIAKTR